MQLYNHPIICNYRPINAHIKHQNGENVNGWASWKIFGPMRSLCMITWDDWWRCSLGKKETGLSLYFVPFCVFFLQLLVVLLCLEAQFAFVNSHIYTITFVKSILRGDICSPSTFSTCDEEKCLQTVDISSTWVGRHRYRQIPLSLNEFPVELNVNHLDFSQFHVIHVYPETLTGCLETHQICKEVYCCVVI